MIIQFSTANFRSINELQTLSMVAASLTGDGFADSNVVTVTDKLLLLRSAAIYGANAAGKSNLFSALSALRFIAISSSSRLEADDGLPMVQPFLLSTETENAPSFFEAVFRVGKRQFRYGLEANTDSIGSEWLFEQTSSRETTLFTREDSAIKVNKVAFKEGIGLEKRVRPNSSFLSVCASLEGPKAREIASWFRSLNIISGLKDSAYLRYTIGCLIRQQHEKEINRLLHDLDVNLQNLTLEFPEGRPRVAKNSSLNVQLVDESNEVTPVVSAENVPKSPVIPVFITMPQAKRDAEGHIVGEAELELAIHASEGTKKLFALAGPIVDTLKNGKTLCVDELDARLHPMVSAALVRLFNSSATNPQNAQLIFVTHDVNLLSAKFLRRDQVWFAEKNEAGATHIYSLAQFRLETGELPRKDASFESDYIRGKFGAIPFLGRLDEIFADSNDGGSSGKK